MTPQIWDDVAAELRLDGEVFTPSVTLPAELGDRQRTAAAQVLDAVAGPVHVVGHSFGAQVALDVALEAPTRVQSLTMICGRATTFPAFRAAATAVRAGSVDADAAMSRWFRPDEIASDGPVVRYAIHCLRSAVPDEWAADLEAVATFDRTAEAPGLSMPVHLVAAEFDQVSTPDAMKALSRLIAGSRFEVWPDAAHLSPFLHPSRLVSLLRTASTT